MSDQIRVIVCDDDPLARSSLVAYLQVAPDILVVGSHDNGAAAMADVLKQQPDVLLTDIRMPGLSGIEVTQLLSQKGLRTRVLLITSFDDEDTVSAIRAGAAGYVLKNVTPAAVIDAVRAVHQGLTVISTGPLNDLLPPLHVDAQSTNSPTAAPDLSPTERDVLQLLCKGYTNAAIAQELYVSESSAKRHLANVMRQLGTTSRLTTVLEAQRQQLDQPR